MDNERLIFQLTVADCLRGAGFACLGQPAKRPARARRLRRRCLRSAVSSRQDCFERRGQRATTGLRCYVTRNTACAAGWPTVEKPTHSAAWHSRPRDHGVGPKTILRQWDGDVHWQSLCQGIARKVLVSRRRLSSPSGYTAPRIRTQTKRIPASIPILILDLITYPVALSSGHGSADESARPAGAPSFPPIAVSPPVHRLFRFRLVASGSAAYAQGAHYTLPQSYTHPFAQPSEHDWDVDVVPLNVDQSFALLHALLHRAFASDTPWRSQYRSMDHDWATTGD